MKNYKNDSSFIGDPNPSHAPGNLCVHGVIGWGKHAGVKGLLLDMSNDIKQVLIFDILDEYVDYGTFTIYPIGTPLLNLSDNKVLCMNHLPNIGKDHEIEKCGLS